MNPLLDDIPPRGENTPYAAAARNKTEEELRRSEEQLSKIFRSSPAGVTVSRRRDGCFLEANQA